MKLADKKDLPYSRNFIEYEDWVKKALRKGLKKKYRDFYVVKSVNRLNDGRYLIELEKEFKP